MNGSDYNCGKRGGDSNRNSNNNRNADSDCNRENDDNRGDNNNDRNDKIICTKNQLFTLAELVCTCRSCLQHEQLMLTFRIGIIKETGCAKC